MLQILVVCTTNSARSLMAASYLRCFIGQEAEVYSAGTAPQVVSELAIRAMLDDNIDLRAAESRPIEDFRKQSFDYIITVCDAAARDMPKKPRAQARLHYEVADPEGSLTTAVPQDEQARYIHCREEVKRQMLRFIGQHLRQPGAELQKKFTLT